MILLGEKNIEKYCSSLVGTFQYNASTKLSQVGNNQKIIWGFQNSEVTLEEIISKVATKDVDMFIKNVKKRELITSTPVIRLINGNEIKETYHKSFLDGCTECELVGIKGKTYMVA